MGKGTLSHELIAKNFFSALGTTEPAGIVRRGTPRTFDENNGVMVIFDERGNPWIKKEFSTGGLRGERSLFRNMFISVIEPFNLQRGAYVPHSNDGGSFVDTVIPNLDAQHGS